MTTIIGHGAVFFDGGDPQGTRYKLGDNVVEQIGRHAFDRTLKARSVYCAFNHDASWVLGRNSVRAGTLQVYTDHRGLAYSCKLPSSPTGQNVAEAIRRGDVTGSSFAFVVKKQSVHIETRNNEKVVVRTILDCDLHECGPVTQPAYTSASTGILPEGSQ